MPATKYCGPERPQICTYYVNYLTRTPAHAAGEDPFCVLRDRGMLAQARRIEQYSRLGMPCKRKRKGGTNCGIPFTSQPEQSRTEQSRAPAAPRDARSCAAAGRVLRDNMRGDGIRLIRILSLSSFVLFLFLPSRHRVFFLLLSTFTGA